MSINEFDKRVKEKFDEYEFGYNPENWERLSHVLPKERRSVKILPWLTGMAASVALIAGSVWYFHHVSDYSNNIAQRVIESSDTHEDKVINEETIQKERKENSIDGHQNTHNALPSINLSSTTQNQYSQVNHKTISNSQSAINTNQSTINQSENNLSSYSKPYDKNLSVDPITQQPHDDVLTVSSSILDKTNPVESITKENRNNPIFPSLSPDEETVSSKERKTSFSLAGGVNYGTMNAAYGAALNARHKVGKNFFIEGDLGFMGSQQIMSASMSTSQYNTVAVNQGLGRPLKVDETNNNIYYVQMTPSIGYQVHKNIAVGLGADLQKLLEGNSYNRTVVSTTDGYKLVPLWDAGVTGKTEYTISNRLKAGLLYREGINNLINSSGNRYLDRRYIQVQMKLRLFGK